MLGAELSALGVNSMDFANFLKAVSQEFEVEISPKEVLRTQ